MHSSVPVVQLSWYSDLEAWLDSGLMLLARLHRWGVHPAGGTWCLVEPLCDAFTLWCLMLPPISTSRVANWRYSSSFILSLLAGIVLYREMFSKAPFGYAVVQDIWKAEYKCLKSFPCFQIMTWFPSILQRGPIRCLLLLFVLRIILNLGI